MLKIKVCGLTGLQDALLAERLGADLLGFVFYTESPRYVSFATAAKILRSLSPFTRKVGVFVNEPAEKVLRAAKRLKLDIVQLAGDEGDAYVRQIQSRLPVIKSFRFGDGFQISLLRNSSASLTLADTEKDGLFGGSGKSFNWQKLSALKGNNRLVLAGGISADNLREAYEVLQPAAVDLTSSLEARPGKKDPVKMKQFFKVANAIRFGL